MTSNAVKRMRVFAIESPDALDTLSNSTESHTLKAVCSVLGHHFASVTVRSSTEFRTALKHITSINPALLSKSEQKWPLCLHIAAHGGEDGLAFGPRSMSWKNLANELRSFIKGVSDYPGPVIVIVSACEASKQTVTDYLEQYAEKHPKFDPPAYLFTTAGDDDGDVLYRDAVVAWSIFYHQIGEAVLDDRQDIMTIIDKIKLVGAGSLKYFRWSQEKRKYRPYRSKLTAYVHPALTNSTAK